MASTSTKASLTIMPRPPPRNPGWWAEGVAGVSSRGTQRKADWESMFCSQPTEHTFVVDPSDIKGRLPTGLQGTFWRNGPGLFEVGSQKDIHNIDGLWRELREAARRTW